MRWWDDEMMRWWWDDEMISIWSWYSYHWTRPQVGALVRRRWVWFCRFLLRSWRRPWSLRGTCSIRVFGRWCGCGWWDRRVCGCVLGATAGWCATGRWVCCPAFPLWMASSEFIIVYTDGIAHMTITADWVYNILMNRLAGQIYLEQNENNSWRIIQAMAWTRYECK